MDGEFAGRVFAARRKTPLAHDGTDIHNHRRDASNQQVQAGARGFHQTKYIHFKDLSQPFRTRVGKVTRGTDAGIVHQHVESAQFRLATAHQTRAVFGAGHIARLGDHAAGQPGGFGDQLFKQIARARLGNDGHATAGTLQRQGPTNALRGTGNYSTQSLEIPTTAHDAPP